MNTGLTNKRINFYSNKSVKKRTPVPSPRATELSPKVEEVRGRTRKKAYDLMGERKGE